MAGRGQIVIFATMAPADYQVIRTTAGRRSEQEWPGISRMLDVGKRRWPRAKTLLARPAITILGILRQLDRCGDLQPGGVLHELRCKPNYG